MKTKSDKKKWYQRNPNSIIGLALLAFVISGLYDLIVRPGIGACGRFFLSVMSFGSNFAKDQAYASAALDPTPIPSLLLLFLILGLLGSIQLTLSIGRLLKTKITKEIEAQENDDEKLRLVDKKLVTLNKLHSKLNKVEIVSVVLFLIFVVWSLSIQNQSILIWRVFHADIRTATPYITEGQKIVLISQFSQVKSEDDYQPISDFFDTISTTNTLVFRSNKLW